MLALEDDADFTRQGVELAAAVVMERLVLPEQMAVPLTHPAQVEEVAQVIHLELEGWVELEARREVVVLGAAAARQSVALVALVALGAVS